MNDAQPIAPKAVESVQNFLREKVEAGQSFGQMARRTGINKATLVRVCNGFSTPSLSTILAICDTYKVTPNQLLGLEIGHETKT